MAHEKYKISVFVKKKFYWNTALLVHYISFMAAFVELNSCKRDWPAKPEIYLLFGSLQKKFADLWART